MDFKRRDKIAMEKFQEKYTYLCWRRQKVVDDLMRVPDKK